MTEAQGQDTALSVPCLPDQPILQPCICPCTQSRKANCRVCLEEDSIANLTQPCSCSGSMQHVHKDCLQSWISEKGSKTCEICRQDYQGSYRLPSPGPIAQPDSLQLIIPLQRPGVIVRADPSTRTITFNYQRQAPVSEEGQDSDDARPSGGAWCLTALMAFMAMLLIRHLFELFYSEQAHQPGKGPSADPQASAGMLLVWLTVRFLVILIPMYAVLRVMHTVRDQQMQQDTDRDLEQELAALLWSMEAGVGQVPATLRAAERAAARATDRASMRAQERAAQLPVIV